MQHNPCWSRVLRFVKRLQRFTNNCALLLTACPAKRSGNMPAEPVRPRPFILAQRLLLMWQTTEGLTGSTKAKPTLVPMAKGQKGNTDNRPRMSVVFRPTPLVCTTCTAMCGSGASITGTTPTTEPPPMGVLGYPLARVIQGCCGVVLGTSVRGTAARPSAAGARAPTRATTSVFGSSALPRGLFNCPLLFSPLALYTS